jgi:HSP20 family protein
MTLNPWADFAYLQNQLDRLAQEAIGMRSHTSVMTLPVDVFDKGDQLIVQAFVPGLRAEHLDIQVEENTVTISGQFPHLYDAEESGAYTWYARELRAGQFGRSINLPYKVDWDNTSATVADGLLTLTFPKAPEARPRRIPIREAASISSTPELTATSGQNT